MNIFIVFFLDVCVFNFFVYRYIIMHVYENFGLRLKKQIGKDKNIWARMTFGFCNIILLCDFDIYGLHKNQIYAESMDFTSGFYINLSSNTIGFVFDRYSFDWQIPNHVKYIIIYMSLKFCHINNKLYLFVHTCVCFVCCYV